MSPHCFLWLKQTDQGRAWKQPSSGPGPQAEEPRQGATLLGCFLATQTISTSLIQLQPSEQIPDSRLCWHCDTCLGEWWTTGPERDLSCPGT